MHLHQGSTPSVVIQHNLHILPTARSRHVIRSHCTDSFSFLLSWNVLATRVFMRSRHTRTCYRVVHSYLSSHFHIVYSYRIGPF